MDGVTCVNKVAAGGYVLLRPLTGIQGEAIICRVPTVFIDGEGHVGRDDLVAADLAELEGAVGVDGLHLQDAVVLLPLDHRGLVGLLLEHRRVLVDVVHLDVHGGPGKGEIEAMSS